MRQKLGWVTTGVAAVAGTVLIGLGPAALAEADGGSVQILAVNDFHGNLDALAGVAGSLIRRDDSGQQQSVQAGGIARMATLVKQARQGQPRSVTVGAGDLIGGSPLMSASYHDEPTVHALEALGLEVSSVGNHEFDEGRDELVRITKGGCHPVDGCSEPGVEYPGAKFEYLAANVVDTRKDRPVLRPYWVKNFSGTKIGFIGLTTRDTPSVVVKSGIEGLQFADEVRTIDRYARELDQKGVKAIVVLIHEGAEKKNPLYDFKCDADGPASGISGPIKSIAAKATPLVDLFISGHSHEPYVCRVDDPAGRPRVITQAGSFGRTFTDIRFDVARNGDVVRDSVQAVNKLVDLSTAEDPEVKAEVDKWRKRSEEIANRPVGYISQDILGRGATTAETPLGDMLADSQVEGTRQHGAQLAFMNTGGMRADLVHAAAGSEGAGVVTYGEAFQIQPFGNLLVTMDLTGEQLLDVLREQYSGSNEQWPRLLQLSDGLRFSVDLSRSGADRLLADTVRIDGEPVRPGQTYRVTTNAFLSEGGNGFPSLAKGTNRVNGGTDLDAFVEYLKAHSSADKPLPAPAANRVTFVGGA